MQNEFRLLLGSGIAARRAGRYAEASKCLIDALALCGAGHDPERADVLRELGELFRNTHDLKSAQSHYEQAVTLLRSSPESLKLAHTVRHLGDVHAEQQHWGEADRCFIEALDIYRTNPSAPPLDLANAIRSHALLKSESGQTQEARTLWLEAGGLYEALGISAGAAGMPPSRGIALTAVIPATVKL